jgi:uncharacterized membrane protein YgdD (TMEM256/DUF423 family)
VGFEFNGPTAALAALAAGALGALGAHIIAESQPAPTPPVAESQTEEQAAPASATSS